MRIYSKEALSHKTIPELLQTLESVKVSNELSNEEKALNIALIETYMPSSYVRMDVLKDIENSKPDIGSLD